MSPSLVGTLALVLALPSPAAAQHASTSRAELPVDEVQIGRMYHEQAAAETGLLDDEAVQTQVTRMVQRLVAASDRPDRIVHVQVLDSDQVNAFALPGGYISVYRGLWELMTPDEVAFVLGHELAHVELRHGSQGPARWEALAAAYEAIEQHLARERAEVDPEDEEAVKAADDKALWLMEEMAKITYKGLGRTAELEADAYGLLTYLRAGYPAEAALSGMAKLGNPDGRTGLYDSHPATPERLAELENNTSKIREVAARFDEGVVLLETGKASEACERLEEVVAVFPRSASAWTNLGMCNLAQVIALSDLPYIDAVSAVAESDIVLKGVPRVALLGNADQALSRASTLGSDEAFVLAARGVLARHSGEPDRAIELLGQARAARSGAAWIELNAANASASAGDLEGADRVYTTLAQDPRWWSLATANRAFVAEEAGRPDDAKQLWEALLEGPQDALARRRLTALGAKLPKQSRKQQKEEAAVEERVASLQIGDEAPYVFRPGMLCDEVPPKGSGPLNCNAEVDGYLDLTTALVFEDGIVVRIETGELPLMPADLTPRQDGPDAWIEAFGQPEVVHPGSWGSEYWTWFDDRLMIEVTEEGAVSRINLLD